MNILRNALWRFLRCSGCEGTGWVRGHECNMCAGDGYDTFTSSGVVMASVMISAVLVALAAWGGWHLAVWLYQRAGQ